MNVKTLGMVAVAATMAASVQASIVVASDNASNYGGGWTSGSNGGTGFGAWTLEMLGGGYKGAFIGNPGNIGVTGMGSSAFALYANGSDASSSGSGMAQAFAYRSFNNALGVGDSFSLQWGINWDQGSGDVGTKGFRLFTGTGNNLAMTIYNYNSGAIGIQSASGTVSDIGFGYGTNAMTWTFTQTTATSVTVTANDRDGSGTYSATFAVNGALSRFALFTGNSNNGGNSEPYFNNFTINAVPAPGAAALLGLAGLVAGRRRR
ncbi:MAG: hypothetical protein RLZZ558_443 [Planctomycetota bacterium]